MDLLDLLGWFMDMGDWLALIAAGAIGYLAGLFVPAGWGSILTSMLLSYHLFLGWLVLTAKKRMQIIQPISYPAMTHLVCLFLIVCLGAGRIFVPHFDVVCCGVGVLAFFERDWLFESTRATAPTE